MYILSMNNKNISYQDQIVLRIFSEGGCYGVTVIIKTDGVFSVLHVLCIVTQDFETTKQYCS